MSLLLLSLLLVYFGKFIKHIKFIVNIIFWNRSTNTRAKSLFWQKYYTSLNNFHTSSFHLVTMSSVFCFHLFIYTSTKSSQTTLLAKHNIFITNYLRALSKYKSNHYTHMNHCFSKVCSTQSRHQTNTPSYLFSNCKKSST